MNVSLKPLENNDYYIEAEITNNTGKEIIINPSYLPWGNTDLYNMSLLIIEENSGKEITRVYGSSCLSSYKEVIDAGQTVSGKIWLNTTTPTREITTKSDITIYWRYKLISEESGISEIFCGKLFIRSPNVRAETNNNEINPKIKIFDCSDTIPNVSENDYSFDRVKLLPYLDKKHP